MPNTNTYRVTEELVSRAESAEMLGLSPRTLDRLTAAGQLTAVRFGRVVRFKLSDLNKLIDSHTCPTVFNTGRNVKGRQV
ncbi:MAG: helix-turn-helix domain-containing protein [Propionibacteriaceae bacterium]|jgi:excisionase family DNA binding protein|nr:helix-turn-helix domain-containing protein [Propionibacteriaceae bacterium]